MCRPQSRYSPLASSRCRALREAKSSSHAASARNGRTSAISGAAGLKQHGHARQPKRRCAAQARASDQVSGCWCACTPTPSSQARPYPPLGGRPRLLPMVARARAARAIQQRRSTWRSTSAGGRDTRPWHSQQKNVAGQLLCWRAGREGGAACAYCELLGRARSAQTRPGPLAIPAPPAACDVHPPEGWEARGASSSPEVRVLGLSSRLLLGSRPRQR